MNPLDTAFTYWAKYGLSEGLSRGADEALSVVAPTYMAQVEQQRKDEERKKKLMWAGVGAVAILVGLWGFSKWSRR